MVKYFVKTNQPLFILPENVNYPIMKSLLKIVLSVFCFQIIEYQYLSNFLGYSILLSFISAGLLLFVLEFTKFLNTGSISTQFMIKSYTTIFIILQNCFFNFSINIYNQFFNIRNRNKLTCLYIIANFYFSIVLIILRLLYISNDIIFTISNTIICTILPSYIVTNEKIYNDKEIFWLCILVTICHSIYGFILCSLINLNYYIIMYCFTHRL